jgi:predicted transcriptional regulator
VRGLVFVQEKPVEEGEPLACINPDGTLTPTAKAVIIALRTPSTPADLARVSNLPIYRVRSTIRELTESGLVLETDGKYQLTDSGMEKL